MSKNFEQKSVTLEPFCQAPKSIRHTQPHFIGIMCSKFHLDDLKTEGEVWDATFHQNTNYMYYLIYHLLTPKYCGFSV